MKEAQGRVFNAVTVLKLDRLGRSTRHLSGTIGKLRDIGIEFISIKDNVDTATAGGRAFLNMLMVFAEFEVDLIRERIMLGLEKAKRDSKHLCRLPLRHKAPNKFNELKRLKESGLSYRQISKLSGIKPSSVHYILTAAPAIYYPLWQCDQENQPLPHSNSLTSLNACRMLTGISTYRMGCLL